MVTNKKININLWNLIGKIATLLTIIWIILQLYSFVYKKKDYNIEAYGEHSIFRIPEKVNKELKKCQKTLALYETYREEIGGKIIPMSKLIKISEEKLNNPWFNNSYEINKYRIKIIIPDYNELWLFNISNKGLNTIENLILEVPFDGYYKYIPQIGKENDGYFNKRIKLIDLPPGYSIKVFCWRNTVLSSFSNYDEKKSRITHKYGVEKIKFSAKVSGLLAWNIKYDNLPLYILIVILIYVMIIIFDMGAKYGPIINDDEKNDKTKIKSLKEKKENDNKKGL